MGLSNASARARNYTKTTNQCQGGGNKKAGLISRIVPSAVSLHHLGHGWKGTGAQPHHKQVKYMNMLKPTPTGSVGVGRAPQGVRFSAWNVIGTSAHSMDRICGM